MQADRQAGRHTKRRERWCRREHYSYSGKGEREGAWLSLKLDWLDGDESTSRTFRKKVL